MSLEWGGAGEDSAGERPALSTGRWHIQRNRFYDLKLLPLVVRVGDVVKFGITARSYLPDSIL